MSVSHRVYLRVERDDDDRPYEVVLETDECQGVEYPYSPLGPDLEGVEWLEWLFYNVKDEDTISILKHLDVCKKVIDIDDCEYPWEDIAYLFRTPPDPESLTVATRLLVSFFDDSGKRIDRFVADLPEALERIAEFVTRHGTDPDGDIARSGRVEFEAG